MFFSLDQFIQFFTGFDSPTVVLAKLTNYWLLLTSAPHTHT